MSAPGLVGLALSLAVIAAAITTCSQSRPLALAPAMERARPGAAAPAHATPAGAAVIDTGETLPSGVPDVRPVRDRRYAHVAVLIVIAGAVALVLVITSRSKS